MNTSECKLRSREGFTLVEVITAMVLLSAVLVCLGGLSYHAARQAVNVSNGAGRQAVALDMVNRLMTMHYDSLITSTGRCDTVSATTVQRYSRCYTVTMSGKRADVAVTITPLQKGSYAQTFSLSRAPWSYPNALNTP